MDQLQLELPPLEPAAYDFVFPSGYGGAVRSRKPPEIHAKIRELRRRVGSLAAKKSDDKFGPKFPVRGAKELNQKLAEALDELDMVVSPVAQDITHLDPTDIPSNERQSGNPVFRTIVHCKSTVRIIAPDTSFIDVVGSGHGGDIEDKSGGKASTYSWKDAILKGLTIPHEDMVDTDDEGGASEGPAVAKGTKKRGPAKKAAAGESTPAEMDGVRSPEGFSGETNERAVGADAGAAGPSVDYVLAQINKAASKADLENIRAQIKSGVLHLEPDERLKASKKFTARMKELENG